MEAVASAMVESVISESVAAIVGFSRNWMSHALRLKNPFFKRMAKLSENHLIVEIGPGPINPLPEIWKNLAISVPPNKGYVGVDPFPTEILSDWDEINDEDKKHIIERVSKYKESLDEVEIVKPVFMVIIWPFATCHDSYDLDAILRVEPDTAALLVAREGDCGEKFRPSDEADQCKKLNGHPPIAGSCELWKWLFSKDFSALYRYEIHPIYALNVDVTYFMVTMEKKI